MTEAMTTAMQLGPSIDSIPIRNAWHLLLYAWDMAAWRGRFEASVERSPSLLGLMSRVLFESTSALLRHELGRAFVVRSDSVRGVRGRIDFSRSLKQLRFEAGQSCCRFSELSVDTTKNRILRETMRRLAGDPRVDHTDPDKSLEIRHRLRSVVQAMQGVSLVPITRAAFDQLQLGRNDIAYALPLAICALVYRLEMPTESKGDHVLTALLRDEIAFHALFERFVRNFWRLNLSGYDVNSEMLEWFDELCNDHVPGMRTDITLTSHFAPHRRLVVDTKYSVTTLDVGHYGRETFKSKNLYQIYAYLRTQEHLSPSHRDAEGILLYPTTSHDFDEAMKVQGHRIRIATLNLAQPWEQVEARLRSLVSS